MKNPLACYLDPLPLIVVLRGITTEEIPAVGAALTAHGFATVSYTHLTLPTKRIV